MELTKTCKVTGRRFTISEAEQEVLRRIGELNPVLGGEPLPLPLVHPYESLRQIFSYSCLRHLFRVPSAVSGTPVLTRYNPELGIKVCSQEEFFSEVENTGYGRPYDFSRGFFEQFFDLTKQVIKPPLNRTNCENSEFVNGAMNLKNCYLCFSAFDSQDCLYCLGVKRSRDCVDLLYSADCELCYSSRDLTRCYLVQHSFDCRDSQELFGCLDCRNCRHCFGCVDLDRQEYQIFNEQVTRERYETFIAAQNLSSHQARLAALQECLTFHAKANHQPNTIINCTDSAGSHLERCENVIGCHTLTSCRSCGYLILGGNDYYCFRGAGVDSEFFHTSNSYGAQVNAYCYTVFGGRNLLYCASMYNGCSDCFGCIALNRKQYCILNRQYSREEYLELCPRIIASMRARGEWGAWFPPRYSWHYYQEAGVHEYISSIPLAEAARRGYRIQAEAPTTAPHGAVRADTLPDDIEGAAAIAATTPILCSQTSRPFNPQKKELEYCRTHRIPVPRIHWYERMQEIINSRPLVPAV